MKFRIQVASPDGDTQDFVVEVNSVYALTPVLISGLLNEQGIPFGVGAKIRIERIK